MRFALKLSSLCLVITLAFGGTALANTKARLDSGEIVLKRQKVSGSTTPKTTMMAVFDASPEKLWAILSDCNRYTKTMVSISAAKELSRKGNIIRCSVTVDLPFPLDDISSITEAIHTVKPGKLYKRAWKLESGDYKHNTGSWTLTPFNTEGTRTLGIYVIHAEPNIPIPDAIRNAAQKHSLPNLVKHLRKQVTR